MPKQQFLELVFDIPEGMSDEEASNRLNEYVLGVHELHKSLGGSGLILAGLEVTSQPEEKTNAKT